MTAPAFSPPPVAWRCPTCGRGFPAFVRATASGDCGPCARRPKPAPGFVAVGPSPARFESLILSAMNGAPEVTLGGVRFFRDPSGPWAGVLSYSRPSSSWDMGAVGRDLTAALLAAGVTDARALPGFADASP